MGRQSVATRMKRLGTAAIDRKPNTAKPTPGHKIDPTRLRSMMIERPSQVWCLDITAVPRTRGLVTLAVVVGEFSRRVLSWRVSITLAAAFCVDALKEALARHGKPDIFNTDQGSQVTSHAFTGVPIEAGVAISLDRKRSWRSNVFVGRLWSRLNTKRSLGAYTSVGEARASIGRYLAFYNSRRPHSRPDGQTPGQAYFNRPLQDAVA